MPPSDKAKEELIKFSREYYRGNRREYKTITEFEKSYDSDKSIYWYTKDSFLYRLVNKALRTEDVGQLHLFRFFISDLSLKLTEIYKELTLKEKTIFMLYRGLKMEMDELKRLKENIGCVISANGFLSTSHSKDVAIQFATRTTKRADITPVIFEIECNLSTAKSIVFGDIWKYSEFAQEEEVLFNLGSTFKIESMENNKALNMTVFKLIATDAGMEFAQKYIELNRERYEETTPDILFGLLLVQMGKYDQSLNYFKGLLNASNVNIDNARAYNGIAFAYLCKSKLHKAYKSAYHAYELMIGAKQCRIKDSTRPMTVMGHVLLREEKHEESLDFYIEALEICNKFSGRKHLDTAGALDHVGNVYYKMKKYGDASQYYEKSFDINVEKLPHVHLDIAANLNNIGLILYKNEFSDDSYSCSLRENENLKTMLSDVNTLNCFEESLRIRKKLLPANHNDIIQSLDNIIRLLNKCGDIDGSLKYFAEKLILQKIDFDPNDPDDLLSRLRKTFKRRRQKLVEYSRHDQWLNSTCTRTSNLSGYVVSQHCIIHWKRS
ncbi:unnamed protein product [Rotaria socialis]|nr:unnamed protein product [Rotaria socialis]